MIIEGMILAGGVYCVKKIQDAIIRSDFLPNAPVVKMPSMSEIAEARVTIEHNIKMLDVIDVEYEEIPNESPPTTPTPSSTTPNFTRETVKEWMKEGYKNRSINPYMDVMAKLMNGLIAKPVSIKELVKVSAELTHDEWVILRDQYAQDAGSDIEKVDDIFVRYIGNPEGLGLTYEENKAIATAVSYLVELSRLKNIDIGYADKIQNLYDFDQESSSIKIVISDSEELEKNEVMNICEGLEEMGAGYIDRTRSPMAFFFNPAETEKPTVNKPKKEKGPNPKRVEFPGRSKPKQQNQQQPQVRTKG